MCKNLYKELKDRQQKEVNNFPIMFAFSNEQFDEGMKKLGLKLTDTDKIYSIGAGGYIRKTDSKALHKMFKRHKEEMEEAIKSDTTGEGFIYQMFSYELSNHEYCITYELDETLDSLDLTINKVKENKILLHGLRKALEKY